MTSGRQRRGDQARAAALVRQLGDWALLEVTRDIAALAGRSHGDLLRTGQPTGVADPLIAATVLVHDLVLITGNTPHYARMQAAGYALLLDNWRSDPS